MRSENGKESELDEVIENQKKIQKQLIVTKTYGTAFEASTTTLLDVKV
jgi:hypothetical protein